MTSNSDDKPLAPHLAALIESIRGKVKTEDEIAALEAEAERERREARLPLLLKAFRSGLPEDYAVMVDEPLPMHPGIKEAAKMAKTLKPGEHLFIHGTSGNAKTHLAIRTALALLHAHALSVRLHVFPVYLEQHRDRDQPNRPSPLEPDVLIMDELDKGGNTPWVYERLYELLQRVSHRKTLIVTSNHPSDVTAALYGGDDPANKEAISSRLSRFISVEVTGADFRPNQKRLGEPK